MNGERLESALKVVAGKFREAMGRFLHDTSLESRGRAERLTGEVALACIRVRSIPRH